MFGLSWRINDTREALLTWEVFSSFYCATGNTKEQLFWKKTFVSSLVVCLCRICAEWSLPLCLWNRTRDVCMNQKCGVLCNAAVSVTGVSKLEGKAFQHRILWYCRDVVFVYFVLLLLLLFIQMCIWCFNLWVWICLLSMFSTLTLFRLHCPWVSELCTSHRNRQL